MINKNLDDSISTNRIAIEKSQTKRENEESYLQNSTSRHRESVFLRKDYFIHQNSIKLMNNQKEQEKNNEIIEQDQSECNSQNVDNISKKKRSSLNLKKLIFSMKLKMLAQRLVNKTRSRMFMNLTSLQFKLIDDKSWFTQALKSKQSFQLFGNTKKEQWKYTLKNNSNGSILHESLDLDEEKRPKRRFCSRILQIFNSGDTILGILNSVDQKLPVLHPSELFKTLWDFISMLFIITFLIQIPLYISFYQFLDNILNQFMIFLAPFYIIIDIIINLNSGFYQKGLLINRRSYIFKSYWRKYSASELLIILAYITHIIKRGDPQTSWSRYLLWAFVLKIKNLSLLFNKWEEFFVSRKSQQLLDLAKLLMIIIILSHFISTFWITLSNIEDYFGCNQTWLSARPIDQSNWMIQYMEAYYFSIVTMATVGYGDVLPITPIEKLSSVILMIISCGLFAYSMNTVGNILDNFNYEENELCKKMQIINTYMSKKNVNKSMQFAVREYLDYYWREASERDQESEQKIISQLSDTLRENLLIEANKIVLKQSPVFRKNFSSGIKQSIISLIKEYRCTPEEIICTEGGQDDCSIYFIEKGSVEIVCEIQSQNQKKSEYKSLVTLKQGQSFGELSFFTGMPRTASVRSKEFTTLLVIKRDSFIDLLKGYSQDFEQFCAIKDTLKLYNDYSCINLKCYSCESSQHLFNQCPYLHFKANQDKILFLYNKTEEQQRSSKIRKQKKSNCFELNLNGEVEKYAQNVVEHYFYHPNIQLYIEGQSTNDLTVQADSSDLAHHNTDYIFKSMNGLQEKEDIILADDISPMLQFQMKQSQILNQPSLKSIQVDDPTQGLQQMQSRPLAYKSRQMDEENIDSAQTPLNLGKTPKNLLVKTGGFNSPSVTKKMSQLKLFTTNETTNVPEQDIQPNYTNYSSLSSVERISPLLKKDKNFIIPNLPQSSIYDDKNSKYESLTPQVNMHRLEKLKQNRIVNWGDVNTPEHAQLQKGLSTNQNKSMLSQMIDLLKLLKIQYENKNEKEDIVKRKRHSILQINKGKQIGIKIPSFKKSDVFDDNDSPEQHNHNQQINDYYDLFGETIEDLDAMRNYEIYFPSNNLNSQLKLMNMNQEDKKKKLIRTRVDNSSILKTINDNMSLMQQSSLYHRNSYTKEKKSSIPKMIQKLQRELQEEFNSNIILAKKSKFFKSECKSGGESSITGSKNLISIQNKQSSFSGSQILINETEKIQSSNNQRFTNKDIDEELSKSSSIYYLEDNNQTQNNAEQQCSSYKHNNQNIYGDILNQDNSNTRMQHIRMNNSNYSFEIKLNHAPTKFQLNESFNIQDISPSVSINQINNNSILNQTKIRQNYNLEFSYDNKQ